MHLFKWLIVCFLLVAATIAMAEDRIGDDRHRYEAPPLVGCSATADRFTLALGADGCVRVSGEGRLAVGYDSSAGFLSWHAELLNVTLALATDAGPAFGVISLRDEGYIPAHDMFGDVYGVTLYEAYGVVGDEIQIRLGMMPTSVNLSDDQPLDWLSEENGRSVFFPIESNRTFPLAATAAQLFAEVSDELTLSISYEDGPIAANFWGADPTSTRFVGLALYDNGATKGKAVVAHFDELGGAQNVWSGYISLGSVISDTFRVLGAVSFGTEQQPDILLTAAVRLHAVELAGTIHKLGGQHYEDALSVSGSLTANVTDKLALRGGVVVTKDASEDSTQVALGALFDASESAALEFEIGRVDDEWGTITYVRGGLDWHINEGSKAKVSAVFTSDGGYKMESELLTAFH